MAPYLRDVGKDARPEPDLDQRIDKLQGAVDSATGHVRNLYVAFLAFAAYLAVTIGGTTDEQLLRVGPVRLPVLNVELPLFAFFSIAPALPTTSSFASSSGFSSSRSAAYRRYAARMACASVVAKTSAGRIELRLPFACRSSRVIALEVDRCARASSKAQAPLVADLVAPEIERGQAGQRRKFCGEAPLNGFAQPEYLSGIPTPTDQLSLEVGRHFGPDQGESPPSLGMGAATSSSRSLCEMCLGRSDMKLAINPRVLAGAARTPSRGRRP